MQLDKIDAHILDQLLADGRISNQDLAQAVGLSPAACLRRMRALEEMGLISGYTAILNQAMLGYHLTAYVEIALASQSALALEAFERAIMAVDEVMECHLMSGENDYLIKLELRDLADYERMHRQVLANLPHVAKIKSSFSIRGIKLRSKLRVV